MTPVGTKIQAEDTVLILEAMKMEMEIKSPRAGTISAIKVEPGDLIAAESVVAYVE